MDNGARGCSRTLSEELANLEERKNPKMIKQIGAKFAGGGKNPHQPKQSVEEKLPS